MSRRRRTRRGLFGLLTRRNRRVSKRVRTKRRIRWLGLASLALFAFVLVTGDEGVRDTVRMGAADADFEALELPDLPSVDVLGALRQEPFLLAHVDFLGVRALDERSLIERAALSSRAPLVDVDPHAVCAALLAVERIEHCVATRFPPDRLIVQIVERDPIAATADGLGVDRAARTFPISARERASLPQISGRIDVAVELLVEATARGVRAAAVDGRSASEVAFQMPGSPMRILARRPFGDDLERYARIAGERSFADIAANELDLRFRGSAFFRDFRETARAANHGGETP